MEFATVITSAAVAAICTLLVNLLVNTVKARSEAQYWEAQERWKLRRDIYLRLLDALWELRDAFQTQLTLENTGDGGDSTRTNHQRQRYARALEKLYEARGTVPLLLHADTTKALDQLDLADAIGCPVPYLEAVKSIYADVLATAHKDLRLRPK